jgi:hypothetical protein
MKSALFGTILLSGAAAVASAADLSATFVNGLAIPGEALDVSGGHTANNGRVGFFSDLYFDRMTQQWWGLSDRGPGGGALAYDTRVQRFDIRIDPATGAISDFAVLRTVILRDEHGNPLNGLAPSPTDTLGKAFDPEGIVIGRHGRMYVSDEYGPSLYEFDRWGRRVARFETPANLLPRDASSGVVNYAGDTGNTAGKRSNRGFEGLAISPNRKYVYAMLQSAMLDEGGSSGVCNRIVKFSTQTRRAVAQYAYQMDGSSQGRGISALVAMGDKQFLVLERNNRGIGVGATLSSPLKKVYSIDLTHAADVSAITLGNDNCATYAVAKAGPVIDLAGDTLAALGNKVPEKWEGLAVGPRLADNQFMMLAGTDNDYSVTQNPGGEQFDVYFNFGDADPFAGSIQCPLDTQVNCFTTTSSADADGYTTVTPVDLPGDGSYRLVPGLLHAYTVQLPDDCDRLED